MSKIRNGSLVVAAVVALTGLAIPGVASANEPIRCSQWNDANTYGAKCTGPVTEYRAVARCSDGKKHYGPLVRSGWSYVYCSMHGAKYVQGSGTFHTYTEG